MANKFNAEQARDLVSTKLGMTSKPTQKYQVYDDEVYEQHVVRRFTMSDVDDPELYVAHPIWEWQQTEHGQWVMKHGKDAQYHMHMEPVTYGYQVVITAHITPRRWTEYCLRFPTAL